MTYEPDFEELPAELRECVTSILDRYRGQSPSKRNILIETLLMLEENHATPDMKMLAKVLQEVRTGLNVFRPYQAYRKVSIFGSARTPVGHPHYEQAKACAKALSEEGFMIITGGGAGLMQAANEGAGIEHSFGININLPLEQNPNPVVHGSPRQFHCQYFFTRKLFFLKESDAVVLTPGGFGTLDEAFETLTLLQTGRNPPIPVVLLEAPGDDYWGPLIRSWMRRLSNDGLISSDDYHLLFHTQSVEAAASHIRDFYANYHSFRYVDNWILLRIFEPLSADALSRLNAEFSDILLSGEIEQVFKWPKSDDHCFDYLPRLRMRLDQHRVNVLPQLIRRMNSLYLQEQ